MARYISKFTGEEIDSKLGAVDDKFGASHWDLSTMTILYFASPEDKQAWLDGGEDSLIKGRMPIEFSGTVRRVQVINKLSSDTVYFTVAGKTAVLTVGFLSQEKGISDASYKEVYEDFTVTVSVDKGSTGSYTEILRTDVLNGNTYSIDVFKYLATGDNRVRITAIGKDSGEQGSLLYKVSLTSMYLSPSNFAWQKPFVEGETYNLGGMNIGGNLQKKLMVKVTNEALGYENLQEENIGTATYTTNAYFYKGMTFPTSGTGTYNVEIWLDADGLESDHLSYNIICVASADANTAQVACINEVSTSAANGSDTEIMKYSLYNGGEAKASPTITIAKDGKLLVEEVLTDVTTSAQQTFSASLEVESEESSFDVVASVSLGSSTDSATVSVDNTASFPAVSGATFYLNAATRNNNQETRENIVNEVDGSLITATSNNMAWVDGMDGWTTDESGRKCLLLQAGTHMTVAKQFLAVGDNKTIELLYKVKNAADYEENIITLATYPDESGFVGLRIKPKNVCLHSRDLASNDLAQGYNTKDEETVHVVISITKNYKTNYGNFAQIYVNGGKKVTFAFTDSDNFVSGANLVLGSETADLYVYKMRVYEQGFGWQDAVQNYINCLPDVASKKSAWEQINKVLDDSYNVDFDAVTKAGQNTMVIEMLNNAVLPDVLHPSGGDCNVTFNINDFGEDVIDDEMKQLLSGLELTEQSIEGQGTTAMTYFRWNFRWKLSKILEKKRRITAKKNVASSMHSHKMGATRMFNELHNNVVGYNEASANVAVTQYPCYGFLKTLVDGTSDQYIYTFIGLYTVGADKGDKPTFGFDNEEFENSLCHLEGTDHTPMGVGFDYPWSAMKFDASKEGFGAINAAGEVVAAYEVGAAGDYATDDAADQDAVQAFLNAEVKPAYEVVYNNSTRIEGVTETLAEINADVVAWRKKTNEAGVSYSDLEFYTDGTYDLYYYNVQYGDFRSNGVNLLTQLGLSASDVEGLTLAEKTELFKSKRRENFIANWETYWHKDDILFHDCFLLIFGASDNGKKNTYPYKFKLIADGGKWRMRQDDLDSIFDINNQGFAAKLFSILFGDQTTSGSIFRGENSRRMLLVQECYQEEIKAMVHKIFDAMAELSPYGESQIDRLVGYVRSRCWDYAQDYFTTSAYNADAEWTYEEAYPLHTEGTYKNDVNPLQQSLGSHYEAERDWIELRMVFMAAYFNWGAFNTDNGDDTSTGQISFRASGGKTYTITPAIDFNPTILIGQSDLATAGKRVKAGEAVDVTVPDMGDNDTHVYIQGADYYSSIGDLKDLQVSSDNAVLTVSSKRMRELKVGDETAENVTSNVQQMNVGSCPSMEEVDARNLASLTGTVDLTRCPRLKKALFGGTSAANVQIAQGSKIMQLSLPDTLTTLSLIKLLNLTEENLDYGTMEKLAYLRVESNALMDGFEMLKTAYANSPVLRNIRIVGFDYEGTGADVDMIANFATATDENGNKLYAGIDEKGSSTDGLPVIDGNLSISTPVYEDAIQIVNTYYPNLKIAVDTYYFRFADAEVNRIVAENWGDGTGTTLEQIEAITSIGTKFSSNTVIETFDEFERFTGVTSIGGTTNNYNSTPFRNCTQLKTIKLPNSITLIGYYAFQYCSSLIDITLPQSIKSIYPKAFDGAAIKGDIHLPNATTINGFSDNPITSFIADSCTSLGQSSFYNCSKMTKASFNALNTIPNMDNYSHGVFENCSSLSEISLNSIVTIGSRAFYNCSSIVDIIIPDSLKTVNKQAFINTSLTNFIANKLETMSGNVFQGTPMRKVILPSIVTAASCFIQVYSLEIVLFGELCTTIDTYTFWQMTSDLTCFVCKAVTPPTLGSNNNLSFCSAVYVPDSSLTAYQEATNWSTYASRIKGISDLPTDNPTLYEEIKDYL